MKVHKGWIALLFLGGCNRPVDPPSDVLRLGFFGTYASLDPIYARDQLSVWLTQQLFIGLVGYDSTLRLVPAAASCWEISPDAKRYRFFLRTDLSYAGHPQRFLKAQDVLYSWHRLADPKLASPGSYLFRGIIRGWSAYEKGQADCIEGLRAIGDSIIEVELERPYAPFLHLLTLPYAAIVLPEAAQKLGRRFGEEPVGLGPFSLIYHEPGRLIVFRRRGRGSPAKLVFRWFPNRLYAWEGLRRGEIEGFEGMDKALSYLLHQDSSWQQYAYLLSVPQLGIEYLGMSVRPKSPFADIRRRWALRSLVQRCSVAQKLFPSEVTPASTFIPPMLLAYTPASDAAADSATAVESLKDLSLTLYASPTARELCEYLCGCLARQGIKLRVEYLLGPSLREFIIKGKAHFWKASWIADFPEGENFLILFESSQKAPAGPNTTSWSHERVDSLIALCRRTPSESERRLAYAQAESLVQAGAPVIPLYHGHGIWLLSRRVKYFPQSALGVWLPLHEVKL